MRNYLFWWFVCFLAACVGAGVAALICLELTFQFIGLSAVGGLLIWWFRR